MALSPLTSRILPPFSVSPLATSKITSLPTIFLDNSFRSMLPDSTVSTTLPLLSMVMRSLTAIASGSLCVMKTMEMAPSEVIRLSVLISSSFSGGDITEVGSSITRILAPR